MVEHRLLFGMLSTPKFWFDCMSGHRLPAGDNGVFFVRQSRYLPLYRNSAGTSVRQNTALD